VYDFAVIAFLIIFLLLASNHTFVVALLVYGVNGRYGNNLTELLERYWIAIYTYTCDADRKEGSAYCTPVDDSDY